MRSHLWSICTWDCDMSEWVRIWFVPALLLSCPLRPGLFNLINICTCDGNYIEWVFNFIAFVPFCFRFVFEIAGRFVCGWMSAQVVLLTKMETRAPGCNQCNHQRSAMRTLVPFFHSFEGNKNKNPTWIVFDPSLITSTSQTDTHLWYNCPLKANEIIIRRGWNI